MGRVIEEPRLGRFLTVRSGIRFVVKRVVPVGEFEKRVLDALSPGNRNATQIPYESALRRARVRFAPTRLVARDTFIQPRVHGPSLKVWLARWARKLDVSLAAQVFRVALAPLREISVWLDRLSDSSPGLRIDTALDNLIFTHHGLTLIDVFPPVNVERFPAPTSRRERLLTELFVSQPTQTAALIHYWFRPFARSILRTTRTTLIGPFVDAVHTASSILSSALRTSTRDAGDDALGFFRGSFEAITAPASVSEWLRRIDGAYVRRSFLSFVEGDVGTIADGFNCTLPPRC
jgi:hypothetical protein